MTHAGGVRHGENEWLIMRYNTTMNRTQLEAFIHENFANIIQDWPWEDTPDYSVFRHADNRKWFALLAKAKYQTLGLDLPGSVDFINLKSDPDLIEDILRNPGILPAYHMNKRHWVTIPLDNSCPADRIKSLVDLSYQLTQKQYRRHPQI